MMMDAHGVAIAVFHHSPFLIPLASYVDDNSSSNTNKNYILRDLSRA